MKTFDEAWETIKAKDLNKLKEDISSGRELMLNRSWATQIVLLAQAQLPFIITNGLSELCATLQTTFQLGLLTGIEMEKEDEKQNQH